MMSRSKGMMKMTRTRHDHVLAGYQSIGAISIPLPLRSITEGSDAMRTPSLEAASDGSGSCYVTDISTSVRPIHLLSLEGDLEIEAAAAAAATFATITSAQPPPRRRPMITPGGHTSSSSNGLGRTKTRRTDELSDGQIIASFPSLFSPPPR